MLLPVRTSFGGENVKPLLPTRTSISGDRNDTTTDCLESLTTKVLVVVVFEILIQ